MKALTDEWISKAEGDYRVALREWENEDPVLDAVCFHAQQAAEKYLKALLVEHDQKFPKTHDLMILVKLCKDGLKLEVPISTDELEFLTTAAVESRYPGLSSDSKEGEKAIHVMQSVRQFIRQQLGLSLDEIP